MVDADADRTVTDADAGAAGEALPRRLGVSRHTDAGALTVLLQDWNPAVTSGLEVSLFLCRSALI
jgi:isopenicillin N synthase-like dioxygenase